MGRPRTEKSLSPELEKLGKRLRMLRLKLGYTNYESFAFEFNLPRAQYGKYETGRADIRYSTLLRIVAAHKLSLHEFFDEGFSDKLNYAAILTDEQEDKILWHLNAIYENDPKWQATANMGMTLLERIEKLSEKDYYYLVEGLYIPHRLESRLRSRYDFTPWSTVKHPQAYPGYPATPEKKQASKQVAGKSNVLPKSDKQKEPDSSTE